MKSNKNYSPKSIITTILAILSFFTSFTTTPVKAGTFMPDNGFMPLNNLMPMSRLSKYDGDLYYENEKFIIENAAGRGLLVSIGGTNDTLNFAPHQVIWNNPDTEQVYQAYCVNPAYPGYGDPSDYEVSIMAFDDSVRFSEGASNGNGHLAGDKVRGTQTTYRQALWGAVTYGYPSKTAEDILGGTADSFGVSQEVLNYAAYAATKFAIWSIVHNNYTVDKWATVSNNSYPVALKQATLTAIKNIYNDSLNFEQPSSLKVELVAGEPIIYRDKNIYETIYTIDTKNIVKNTPMYIRMDSNNSPFPDNMVIADMNDKAYSMNTASGRNEYIIPSGTTQFKVIVPIPSSEEYKENYDITLFAQIPVKTLVFAKAQTNNVQDYILAGNGYSVSSDGFIIENTNDGNDTPKPPEPPTPTPPTGLLEVIKISAKDNITPIQGATFDVYNSLGQLIDTGTTDATGKWKPNIKNSGTYTIVERSTNPDYQLTEPTTLVVVVEPDKTTTATFRNFPKQDVTIWKEDAITGEPIPGVQYEIYQIDGKGAWRAVSQTDNQGRIIFEGVPDGTYLVREVSTIGDYILDRTPQYVTIKNGQAPSLKFLNNKKPGLNILKIDKQTGLPINNPATFSVNQIDGSYSKFVTTVNGSVSLEDLPVGLYKIMEVSSPNGYVINKSYETVYLGAGENKTVYMYNLKSPILTIEKFDAQTGVPIPGTKFEIKKTNGTVIGTVTTDTNGKVILGMDGSELGYLEPSTYTVKEVFVPKPYVLSNESQDIQLNAGDVKSLFFGNLEMPKIIIEKYDEDTLIKLPDAEFGIYEQEDMSRPVVEGITDKNGQLNSGYIKPGTYVIREINPPPGYMLSNKTNSERVIVAKAGDGEIVAKFDNKKLPELTIKKIDAITKEPISGVAYKVEKTDDKSIQPITLTTDVNGLIVISGLETGTYTITEISAPSKYILNSIPQHVKLEGGDNKSLLFENTLLPTLVVQKRDYITNKPVADTTFTIERENIDGSIVAVGTYRTDKDGKIVLPFVPTGWYIITETIPSQGMQIPSNPVTRIFLDAGTNSYSDFSNGNIGGNSNTTITSGLDYPIIGDIVNYPLNSIVIKKSDANTGEMLAGATFEVIKVTGATSGQNGTVVCTVTTDVSGVVVITGLEAGAYTVREIKAPENYTISETNMQSVNLKADGTSIVEVLFNNYPYGSLLITKVDGITGKPLANAKFKVTDNSGAVVGNTTGEYITNSNGEILIPNVKPGSYIITEIQAPSNYAINDTPKTIEVGTDGKVYKASFDNYPYGSILITKVDSITGKPLANAKFKITDNNGKVVGNSTGEYTTDSKGEILISNITPGDYIVTEIQAPANYAINNTPKTVRVGTDGNTYKLSFDNYPYGTLIIKKLDAITKEPLANAEFKVTTSKGDVIGKDNGIFTTDETGLITISNLPKGSYIVKETKAPNNYILENQSKTIQVEYGKTHTLEFYNNKKSGLQIIKIDSDTKQPLKHAKFTVYKKSGEVIGNYETDAEGIIIIDNLEPGWIKIVETKAPDGYLLDETPKDIEITNNQFVKVTFENNPMSSVIIKKYDVSTKKPLAGAKFKITKKSGDVIGEYTTDDNGMIQINELSTGWYSVVEIKAPDGYKLVEAVKDFEVKHTKTVTLEFPNEKLTSLVIKKVDDKSGEPLAGASFKVEKQNGELIGEYSTDKDGLINIPTLIPDWYIVRETKAPNSYLLDNTPKTVEVKTDVPTLVTFTNKKLTGIQIKKIDEFTGAALAGAEFTITKQNGERIGDTYTTDDSGFVNIPNLQPDYYIVTEIKAPKNYLLDNTPKTVQVKTDTPTLVTFTNRYKSGFQIIKVDASTGEPLAGAKFTVYKKTGDIVGDYVTDKNGVIIIDNLENGWYKIAETKAPDGYMIDETPKDVEIIGGQFLKIVFENKKLAGLQIKKIDEITGVPLAGAKFTIEKQNGEKIYTNENGTEFVTDEQGFINIPSLAPDYYIIKEIKAPKDYILDETPKTVQVKTNTPTTVTFTNQPLSGLKIIKLNAVTKEPIAGVEFNITKMNGEKINNDYQGYTFKTDKIGQIYIPNLEDGIYHVTETKAADGYFIDSEPKTIEVKSGKTAILEVLNQPSSGLLIVKTDSNTGKPLAGVEFDVRKSDGQRITGNIIDQNQPNTQNNSPNKTTTVNGDISGSYTTDANGRILINTLEAGEYHVVETKALDGYIIDTDVHSVTITPGKQTTLKLTNTPKAGLRILKIDSITKAPIFGVEFMVFDENKKVIGTYYSDNNGIVDLSAELPEGQYTIRETKAAQGYYLDEIPKTIEFKSGKVTEIVWTNTPQMGQIQLLKVSADDNEVNGLPAGTPLEGAIFEIYSYKSGNLVDRFTSGSDGKAISNPLPIGRYIVKEVKAPQNYRISDKQLDIEIEFATQIIKQEFVNYSVNTGVHIKKTGNVEAMPGNTIRYDIKAVQNTSTVPLTDFFWRDIIPTDATRLEKIVTGTYNQSLKYKVMITTNKGDTRVIADNLSTVQNNVIGCSNAELGLKSDEYVTSFSIVFGTVKAGFTQVEQPQIYMSVLKNLPNGYQFANKVDIGGKYQEEWVIGNSTWLTTIYTKQGILPRTGY